MSTKLEWLIKQGLRKIAESMGLQEVVSKQREIASDISKLYKILRDIESQITVTSDGLPIPPHDLHFLVSGNYDLGVSDFLTVGKFCADSVTGLLNKNHLDIDGFEAVLDFGCGCGRVIRHFNSLKNAKLYGTDYNPVLVEWCRKNLPFAQFQVNKLAPPLNYNAEKFDLVYAFSVFTHLPETLQFSWMNEISRVLKPGGYAFITTHGVAYIEGSLNPRERELFQSGQLIVVNEGSAGENKCSTYHPEGYVRNTLAVGFEIVDFVPGWVLDSSRRIIAQDSYLLKKAR